MCGRYIIISEAEKITTIFQLDAYENLNYKKNYNVSAGNIAPIICQDKPRKLTTGVFGFTPSWSDKLKYVINARSEGDQNKENRRDYRGAKGIIQKPFFRTSIRSKRCIIPANCFVEGPQEKKLNEPYCVYIEERKLFGLAGIYDDWENKETGETIRTFAVLTVASNKITSLINHNRSPVILGQGHEKRWLEGSTELADVTALLRPYEAEKMNAFRVSTKIKSPEHNSRGLIEPVGPKLIVREKIILDTRKSKASRITPRGAFGAVSEEKGNNN